MAKSKKEKKPPHCTICRADLKKSLRISPQDHERKHDTLEERACEDCWEAWLSLRVEEKKADETECLFCKSTMSLEWLKTLSRKPTLKRYDRIYLTFIKFAVLKILRYEKKLASKRVLCMNRCTKPGLRQAFDRQKDGRVFTCAHCDLQVCIDCDRPEHVDETCAEYGLRLFAVHGDAEAETSANFRYCPSCNVTYDHEGCGYTECRSCKHRFCDHCMVPWVGEGSVYSAGKEAHGEGCLYRTRDRTSKYALKHRFQETEEVLQRIAVQDKANKAKLEARKTGGSKASSTQAPAPKNA